MISNANRHELKITIRGSDFDRLEDIGADAMMHARQALAWCEDLTHEVTVPLRDDIGKLRDVVHGRQALTRNGRLVMHLLMLKLEHRLRSLEADNDLRVVIEALRDGSAAAERVADLLGAERHVGFCRGIVTSNTGPL